MKRWSRLLAAHNELIPWQFYMVKWSIMYRACVLNWSICQGKPSKGRKKSFWILSFNQSNLKAHRFASVQLCIYVNGCIQFKHHKCPWSRFNNIKGFSIQMICFLNIISHTFNGCLYFNYSFLNFSFESGKGCGLPKQNRGSFHGGIILGVLSRHDLKTIWLIKLKPLLNQTKTSTWHTYLTWISNMFCEVSAL